MRKMGLLRIDRNRLCVVKGYYNDPLTPELQRSLLGKSIAVAMIDCELYESTVPVLEFIRPFLQQGSILVFDDCSRCYGSEKRGREEPFLNSRRGIPSSPFKCWCRHRRRSRFS